MKNRLKIFLFCFFVAVELNAMFSPRDLFILGGLPKAMKIVAALEAKKTCFDHLQAALCAAVAENNTAYIQGIIDLKGIDINAPLSNQATVLHLAALWGTTKAAAALLDRGADINVECGKNLTPLIMAMLEGHIGMVELLLERGAKIRGVKGPQGEDMNILDGIMLMEDEAAEVLQQKQSEIAVALIRYGAKTQAPETLKLLTTLGVQYPLEVDHNDAELAQDHHE